MPSADSLEELNIEEALLYCAERNLYLTRRNELQRPQRGLHVRDIRLQVVEGICDTGLELRRLLPRRARCCDLVEGSHGCDREVVAGRELRFMVGSQFCVGAYDRRRAE